MIKVQDFQDQIQKVQVEVQLIVIVKVKKKLMNLK